MLFSLFVMAIALLIPWAVILAIESCFRTSRPVTPFSDSSRKQVSLFSLLLFLFAPFNLIQLLNSTEPEASIPHLHKPWDRH